MKLLYVCPFAHYTGHFSWAARYETSALSGEGVDVTLLTFCGVMGKEPVTVDQTNVKPYIKVRLPLYYLANFFRKSRYARWISMFLETYLTFSVAIKLKNKLAIDVIYVRDGEPFLFLLHFLNLPLHNYRWIVSLTGTNLVVSTKPENAIKRDFRLFVYTMLLRITNSNFWNPTYVHSMKKNNFLYITQNNTIKNKFELYARGALAGKIICLSIGVESKCPTIPKEKARQYLGLPQGKALFLSFGFLHAGKDVETVIRALSGIENAVLLHAGDQGFRLNVSGSKDLAEQNNMADRIIIHDHFIPEKEKPYYFFAADAIILSYTRDFLSTASLLWESCHFGIPVIASDNGQLGELMELYQPGLVFKAQDTASLKDAVLRFINLKPEEIERFRQNCDKFLDDFSLPKWAHKFAKISNGFIGAADHPIS